MENQIFNNSVKDEGRRGQIGELSYFMFCVFLSLIGVTFRL